MIPKTIHYCWFGRNPMPRLAKRCIRSWKRHCPDWEIVEWNEDNFDVASAPLYVRQAYEAGKWAFVTDYVRLWAVYQHGGVYLDTDVEVVQALDKFLENDAYFGFQDQWHVNTGLGFGAIAGHPILRELLEDYEDIVFVREDGSIDWTPCPNRNTEVLIRHGLVQDDTEQILFGGVHVYPTDYFCPLDFETRQLKKSRSTATIHWYASSWLDRETKRLYRRRRWESRATRIAYRVKIATVALLGNKRYEVFKRVFRRS